MRIKGSLLTYKHRLFGLNGQNTGNDLVTELCPKRTFPCLSLSFLPALELMKITVNQLICFNLLKIALRNLLLHKKYIFYGKRQG